MANPVLILGPIPPPTHGVSVFTHDILDALSRSGKPFLHLDTSDRRSPANIGHWDLANLLLGLRHSFELFTACVRHQPAAVYLPISQNRPAFLRDALFSIIALGFRSRLLLHIHGASIGRFLTSTDPLTRRLASLVFGSASTVIVLGERLREMLNPLNTNIPIAVIPNGVPDIWSTPDLLAHRRNRRAADTLTIGFLSTLIESKGLFTTLEALALLRDRGKQVRGVFAGPWLSDETEKNARRLVETRGLEEIVLFPGILRGETKRQFFLGVDILALPTSYPEEGAPLVLLESLAAGIPFISTCRGAIPEILGDSRAGELIPEKDPMALATSALRLWEQPLRYPEICEAARRRYLAEFRMDICMERLSAAMFRG